MFYPITIETLNAIQIAMTNIETADISDHPLLPPNVVVLFEHLFIFSFIHVYN